jgi:uncharacterized membrane protein YhaH (DUF805 family)
MGPFAAVGSVYAKTFTFSGRARRAEYWWFALYVFLATGAIQAGIAGWVFLSPEFAGAMGDPLAMERLLKTYEAALWRWWALYLAALVFLFWLPQLAVTVRRLHDTGRSGWWMFKPVLVAFAAMMAMFAGAFFGGGANGQPFALVLLASFVPLACTIWYLVVLCLPGTRGENRFGPDPVPGRAAKRGDTHPALVKEMDEELGRQVAQRRKAEFQDYYRARVLPAIERNKSRRTS